MCGCYLQVFKENNKSMVELAMLCTNLAYVSFRPTIVQIVEK